MEVEGGGEAIEVEVETEVRLRLVMGGVPEAMFASGL